MGLRPGGVGAAHRRERPSYEAEREDEREQRRRRGPTASEARLASAGFGELTHEAAVTEVARRELCTHAAKGVTNLWALQAALDLHLAEAEDTRATVEGLRLDHRAARARIGAARAPFARRVLCDTAVPRPRCRG